MQLGRDSLNRRLDRKKFEQVCLVSKSVQEARVLVSQSHKMCLDLLMQRCLVAEIFVRAANAHPLLASGRAQVQAL